MKIESYLAEYTDPSAWKERVKDEENNQTTLSTIDKEWEQTLTQFVSENAVDEDLESYGLHYDVARIDADRDTFDIQMLASALTVAAELVGVEFIQAQYEAAPGATALAAFCAWAPMWSTAVALPSAQDTACHALARYFSERQCQIFIRHCLKHEVPLEEESLGSISLMVDREIKTHIGDHALASEIFHAAVRHASAFVTDAGVFLGEENVSVH